MEYRIVPMAAHHVPAVAALETQCFSDPWSESAIAPELQNPLSLWLAAEALDGTLLGYVGSQRVPPEADMMNIAVAPAARRQGIAESLVLALIRALDECGVTSLTLEVRVSNLPAASRRSDCAKITIFIRKRMPASSERTGTHEYFIC